MNNPPAFPLAMPDQYHPEGAPLQQGFIESGMTLRDYFAAYALQGLLSNPKLLSKGKTKLTDVERLETSKKKSRRAYEYADAMLAEREKGQQ